MSAPVTVAGSRTKTLLRWPRRRWVWIAAACIVFGVPAFYAVVFYLYWPFTKQDVIDVLQERSLRSVTIDKFHTTYFPPGCVAEGI